ncbi:MAG: 2Fe-2S iron-sulfur cluster-binding protein [Polyangiales bacterium]
MLGRSVKYHRPRGAVCFGGRCDGCLMRVDGLPNVMTCHEAAHEGAVVETQNVLGSAENDLLSLTDWFFSEGMDHHHMFTRFSPINRVMRKVARRIAGVGTLPDAPVAPVAPREAEVDVLVIGGGASGVIAANAAAKRGARTMLVEERRLGGEAALRGEALPPLGPPVELREHTVALGIWREVGAGFAGREQSEPVRWVLLGDGEGLIRVRANALVIATGAEEGALPVAGNDRPGIVTALGALRLLDHGVLVGERLAFVGDEEALHVARARLVAAGAVEVGSFGADEVDAIGGRPAVAWLKARGERVSCDAVVTGSAPSAVYALAGQAGAEVRFDGRGFLVVADDEGRTHDVTTFAIGRCTGRAGDRSRVQAEAAGRLAARPDGARSGETSRGMQPTERFTVPKADKLLACRCEDVTAKELAQAVSRGHGDLEGAKRYTGFGTGWCQGKQCVALCARLLAGMGGEAATEPITPRPPVHPIALAELALLVDEEEPR